MVAPARPTRFRLIAATAAALIAVVGGLAITARIALPPLRAVTQTVVHTGQVVQAQMAANWLAFGMGQALVAASGVIPASLIAVMAGASYGLVWGTLLSAISTMLGGWAAFALSRSLFRGMIERRIRNHPAMIALNQGLVREGWRFVMLLRVSPVMPFALTSYGLGLTPISQRDFLLGTLASLPALVGYVALGAMGRESLMVAGGAGNVWRLFTLVGGTGVVFYAFWRIRRAMVPVLRNNVAAAIDWLKGPRAPGETVFSDRQKWALVAAFAVLVILRMPRAVWDGRFYSEEGTTFFAYAWHRAGWAPLWRSFGGYCNLAANAATLLAARLVRNGLLPLGQAPHLTMAIALVCQTFPAMLLLYGRARWLSTRWAVIASLLVIVLCPRCEEVWLNTLHIQFHLALCCGLILALDCPRTARGWLAQAGILVLAPLCGPGPIVIAPLFVARAVLDRSAPRLAQAALILGGSAIQLTLFFVPNPMRGALLDPATLASILFVRFGALPLLGATIGNAIGDLGTLAYTAHGMGWWAFSALSLAACAAMALLAWRKRGCADGWLIAAGMAVAIVAFGGGMLASNPAEWMNTGSGERYNFLPLVLIDLGLIAVAQAMTGPRARIAHGVVAMLILAGLASYFTPLRELTSGPDWAREAALWQRDHDYQPHAWPARWTMDLSDRDRPCPAADVTTATLHDPGYCESWWLALVQPHLRPDLRKSPGR